MLTVMRAREGQSASDARPCADEGRRSARAGATPTRAHGEVPDVVDPRHRVKDHGDRRAAGQSGEVPWAKLQRLTLAGADNLSRLRSRSAPEWLDGTVGSEVGRFTAAVNRGPGAPGQRGAVGSGHGAGERRHAACASAASHHRGRRYDASVRASGRCWRLNLGGDATTKPARRTPLRAQRWRHGATDASALVCEGHLFQGMKVGPTGERRRGVTKPWHLVPIAQGRDAHF
jgi:hypothetical protein